MPHWVSVDQREQTHTSLSLETVDQCEQTLTLLVSVDQCEQTHTSLSFCGSV